MYITGFASLVGSVIGAALAGYYRWRGKPVRLDDQGGETFSIVLFMLSFLILILILSSQWDRFKDSFDTKQGWPLYLSVGTVAAFSLWGAIEAVKGVTRIREVTENDLPVKVDIVYRRLFRIPWTVYYIIFIFAVYVIIMEYNTDPNKDF